MADKRPSFELVSPESDAPDSGQACMRSTRMQADLISIAAHRLTPQQQARLKSIAQQLRDSGRIDTTLYETFKSEVSDAKLPSSPKPKRKM